MAESVQFVPDTGYFNRYIQLIGESDIMSVLERQCDTTTSFFKAISEEKSLYRYAEGKWSIRQIAGHISDAERVFAYRGLCFARNDKTILPTFDENSYVDNADFDNITLKDLTEELRLIRESNIALFKTMSSEVLERKGTAGAATLSVRDILYIIAGHQKHHINVITERYL